MRRQPRQYGQVAARRLTLDRTASRRLLPKPATPNSGTRQQGDPHEPWVTSSWSVANVQSQHTSFSDQPQMRANEGPTRQSKNKNRTRTLIPLIALAFIAISFELLRIDLLPLLHVSGEALIWAAILSALALFCYIFFLTCRWLFALHKRRYKLPVIILLSVFAVSVLFYASLNVLAQSFDPTIDKALANLPPPGRKKVFVRRNNAYEEVDLPVDRRISAEEIATSYVRDVVIVVEDERFESRLGPIDLEAVLRGTVRTFVLQSRREGGSTILIQAAKNVLRARNFEQSNTSPAILRGKESLARALRRKCAEFMLSLRLAQRFPRADEQLALYLSVAPMGGSDKDGRDHTVAYTAADLFGASDLRDFNRKDQNEQLASAMLVGMLKGPTSYHPRLHPLEAVQRRNVVLSQLANAGMLTQDLGPLQAKPINLRDTRHAKNLGFYYTAAEGSL